MTQSPKSNIHKRKKLSVTYEEDLDFDYKSQLTFIKPYQPHTINLPHISRDEEPDKKESTFHSRFCLKTKGAIHSNTRSRNELFERG